MDREGSCRGISRQECQPRQVIIVDMEMGENNIKA